MVVQKVVEQNTDGNVKADFNNNQLNFQSDNGENKMQVGQNVVLPDNFPTDVPRYPGAEYSATTVDASGKTAVAMFNTDTPSEEVQAWYKSALEGEGFSLGDTLHVGSIVNTYTNGAISMSIQTT